MVLDINDYYTSRIVLENFLSNFNTGLADRAETFHNSLYSETGIHVTGLVNTYYIAGYGDPKSTSIQTVTRILLRDIENKIWDADKSDFDGDGMVTKWSATQGDMYASRTYYAKGVSHINLVDNVDVLVFITELIGGNTTPTSNSLISSEKEEM